MKLKTITSETLPQAKPNLILLGKFLLMSIGFIIGRRLHIEISKYMDGAGSNPHLLQFKSLFGTGDYVLTAANLVTMVVSFLIYWLTSRKMRILRWFGVGLLLYIVTFEFYELVFGRTMGFEVPDVGMPTGTTSTTSGTTGI